MCAHVYMIYTWGYTSQAARQTTYNTTYHVQFHTSLSLKSLLCRGNPRLPRKSRLPHLRWGKSHAMLNKSSKKNWTLCDSNTGLSQTPGLPEPMSPWFDRLTDKLLLPATRHSGCERLTTGPSIRIDGFTHNAEHHVHDVSRVAPVTVNFSINTFNISRPSMSQKDNLHVSIETRRSPSHM